jgi:dipeptidyl aminopeptidase/acylaminoacyl peptidase
MPIGAVTNIALLVGHGYAVLTPSLPVPKAGRNEPMAGLAERILKIVDQAAADPRLGPTFDPTRLALWGHSFGAFTVQGAITQSPRFRAAVALSGNNDLISRWGAFSPPHELDLQDGVFSRWSAGSVEFLQGGMGAPPWVDPARYVRNSPLLAAGCITTPLMLVSGDQDISQPAQPELMFSALYRQNKDALLVTYWGESHVISSPGNVRDLWARAFGFLDRNFNLPPKSDPGARSSCQGPDPASSGPRPR